MKRLLLLLLLLPLLLCACGQNPENRYEALVSPTPVQPRQPEPPATASPRTELDDGVFTLVYSASDSLNPYSCKTQRNQELCPLLYETLVSVTPEFTVEPALCASWETGDGGASFLLTLRSGAVFSDGSEVTGWDAAYSLNRAKETGHYAARLQSMTGATVTDGGVRITLSEPNPSFPLRLDIPIVKEGTAYSDLPTGSGRFCFAETENGARLECNAFHPGAESLPCSEIRLSDVRGEALMGAFQQGEVDWMTVQPGEKVQQSMNGAVRHSYPTTVLALLLADAESRPLESPERRRLVNSILDRGELAAILDGEASLTPLHPQLAECDTAAAEAWLEDDLAAYCIQILAEDYDADGMLEYLPDGLPVDFTLRLGVCSANDASLEAARSIASRLERAGVGAELLTYDEAGFEAARKKHECDLYLVHYRLTNDFDVTGLAKAAQDDALLSAAETFRAADGEARIQAGSEVCAVCAEQCRIFPLVFCRGAVYSRAGAITNMEPTCADLFRNLTEWDLREFGSAN